MSGELYRRSGYGENHRAPVRDYITVRRFAEDAGDNDFKYDALSENELSKILFILLHRTIWQAAER